MENKVLQQILSSEKIHLTQTQKNFVKETFIILSIFADDIEQLVLQKFNEIIKTTKNKFDAGKVFYNTMCQLRYPVSYEKLIRLKKIKKQTFEFDESSLQQFYPEIISIVNKI